jgi:Ca2+-dependent lipid-binding protein
VSYKYDPTKQFLPLGTSILDLGRTETIKNELNPNYSKTFVIDYLFESRQDIKFELFDDDGNGKDDYIGFAETTVGNLMGAKGQTSILDFKNTVSKEVSTGKLVVRC